jgi:hypothetical protein
MDTLFFHELPEALVQHWDQKKVSCFLVQTTANGE